MLRDGHKPRDEGNLLALEPLRISPTIPMLVQVADSDRNLMRKADPADDLRPTITS